MNPVEHHAYRMDEAAGFLCLTKCKSNLSKTIVRRQTPFPVSGKNIFSRSEKMADIDKQ